MEKLDIFGYPRERLVGVLYGHHGSGKVYNYTTVKNIRTGDIVTPEVTHAISGTTYKTLARVVYTRNANSNASLQTESQLLDKGIFLKTIGHTDQRALPGYYPGWGKDSDEKYEEDKMRRINMYGE